MSSGQVVRCDVNDVYSNLMEMLEENVTSNHEAMARNIRAAGEDCAEHIAGRDYPYEGREREYAHGWKAEYRETADGHMVSVVRNVTQPSLTHLIEKGHELFIGGHDTGRRTRAKPYIREGYEHAAPIATGGGVE